ncbi:hypothetical protein LZG75_08650 [Polynucleobacter sp. IMCC30063]|uniref:hypothetical protein n=1 Tax=unclassified Polynucleobacter TaxID=2640945 RepID=UPI001F3A0348|nr:MULTISPECIES: hypothetical protein [unclassified Polynucleobacter]MCE7506308.1 hypothetical protein [Polynucleobacter sp. IMCC30063]MCE7527588.1 hypothetical protein [Polynucleobacter sp. IMCC 30228]MCE7529406.1 hypothetical protein [Polynucleobacter sp. IMCC 29146]
MRKYLGLVVLIAASSYLPSGLAKTCAASATEKKLTGAAKSSFLKKCEKDIKAACEASANEKKLTGAVRHSHVLKCSKDAASH